MDLESRYELLEKIGTGSYATVFRARDAELGREVAIKQIHEQYLSEPKQLDRYWQEAQLLASLQHPNIVTIFDIYRERGWLILELMQTNLGQRMEGRQMDLRALRTTLAHCLRALKYLHSRGVVHGDIKPSNLMIDSRKRVKIGDFGLARRVSDEEGSLLKGTTKYMAPESVADDFGEVGPASDLYSLGFAAYELMCGPNFETLFPGLSAFGRNKQVAWMMWHAARDRRLPEISRVLEGVPDDLQHVIQKLVEKDQSKRYQSADDALSDLNIDLKVINKGGDGDIADSHDGTDDGAKKKRLMLIGALAMSLILSVVALVMPSGNAPPADMSPKKVYGIVREVLADTSKLVIEDVESGQPDEYTLVRKPKILLDTTKKKELVLLRQLAPGDRVELELPAKGAPPDIASIVASRPVVSQGRLKNIDIPNKRVVIAVEEGDIREDIPIRVPDRTSVTINGERKGLRDLKEQDSVGVRHFPAVSGEGGRIADEIAVRRLSEAVGYVGDVDPGRRRLTVRFAAGAVLSSLSLPLADDCEVVLRGKGGQPDTGLGVDDLAKDDRVRVHYDTQFRQVFVTRDAKTLSGTVQDVRPPTRELVVGTSAGRTYTFRLDPLVERNGDLVLDRDAIALGDLRQHDRVDVTYDDSTRAPYPASSVVAIRPTRQDRWAIVITGEIYDEKFLSPIRYATDDAELVKQALRTRYAVAEDRLLYLRDETAANIQKAVTEMLDNARSQTQVVIYVSSHAYRADNNQVYLAGRDLHWDRIADTGLSLDWLVARLEVCASQDKLLILDCSRQGEGKDREKQPSTAEMVEALVTPRKSTTIVASCAAGERGLMMADQDRGLFGHCVADSFAGRADADRDLHLTPQELIQHLQRCMSGTKAEGGGRQTPVLFAPGEGRSAQRPPERPGPRVAE